jgi:acetylornithine/N-succinyldiaminopimelate aminotransferase
MKKRVLLKSFNGKLSSPRGTSSEEDYWKLIGQTGEILEPKNERGRILVRFDVTVKSFGRACHNPIENSLYILESDLEMVE